MILQRSSDADLTGRIAASTAIFINLNLELPDMYV